MEQLRTPWLTDFFLVITQLGAQAVAILVTLAVFWCIDRDKGWRLLLTLLLSTFTCQLCKGIFRIPRPHLRDSSLHPVTTEGSFSFPSGHSQCAAVLYGVLGLEHPRRSIRLAGGGLLALVALSRMYLGVHTPADVLCGMALGLGFSVGLRALLRRFPTQLALIFWLAAGISGAALLTAALCGLAGGSSLLLFGLLLGAAGAYCLGRRWDAGGNGAPASLLSGVIRYLLGLVSVSLLFLFLRYLGLTHGLWAIPSYGLVAFYALGIYPWMFRFIDKRVSL